MVLMPLLSRLLTLLVILSMPLFLARLTLIPIKFFFFFFSSRRRHTRWTGDWSSDVCSSDLRGLDAEQVAPAERLRCGRSFRTQNDDRRGSEERRVGKECRSRWSPYH